MNKLVKACVIILIILVLLPLGGYLYYRTMLKARPSADTNEIGFEVKEGSGSNDIIATLADRGLIKSKFAFKVYIFLSGDSDKLKAGVFAVPANSTIPEVVDILVKGEETANKITVIPGWRLEEIARYLNSKGVSGDFLDSAKVKNYESDFSFLQGLDGNATLEGFLFPDTYTLSTEPSADEFIEKALTNFQKKIQTITPASNEELSNLYDLVKLASIVQREAGKDKNEKKIIAGVFVDRLKKNMNLQSDPTAQYARDSLALQKLDQKDALSYEFWKGITEADLNRYDSPYNTYLHKGLPIGPICTPSLDALSAAFHPDKNDYLYFLHKNGSVIYSKTAEEHQRAKER